MLPNNQPEGNSPAPTGGQEQPTSAASGAQSQPLPEYVATLQGQIADLTKLVNGLQKGTDKQIGQVRGDIKRILELKDKGLDETQIQRELWIDQQMSPPSQSAPVQQSTGSGQQPNAGLDTETLITSLKFEPNDPALAALKIKYANDPKGLVNAAADLRLAQFQTPNPTPGTSLPQSGNAPVGGLTPQLVEQKSIQLQRLYDNYSANKPQIESLEAELNEYWKTHPQP